MRKATINFTGLRCCECGTIDMPLHRTVPKGQLNENWICIDCLKKIEPELAKNEAEEMTRIEFDLVEILTGKSNHKKVINSYKNAKRRV